MTTANEKRGIIRKVCDFYVDGFKSMTIGKTLWTIILIKLFIIFAVLKLFFFPNFLKENAPKDGEAEYVARQLTETGR